MLRDMTSDASVSIHVDAPPEVVYDLVSDLPRMGEWSPECVRCEWLGGATGAAVGARFKGYNRRGPRRWSTKSEVVAAEPGAELAWEVSSVLGLRVARWGYRITATPDGGSDVVETFDDRRGRTIKVLGALVSGVRDRGPHNTSGMEATLQHIKHAAEDEAATRL
jgi:hypothetical protein